MSEDEALRIVGRCQRGTTNTVYKDDMKAAILFWHQAATECAELVKSLRRALRNSQQMQSGMECIMREARDHVANDEIRDLIDAHLPTDESEPGAGTETQEEAAG